MSKVPQKRTAEFKLMLVIEALKGDRPITEIASEHGIHPKQIHRWRSQLIAKADSVFAHKGHQRKTETDREDLLRIIERLNLELDFFKKKLKRND